MDKSWMAKDRIGDEYKEGVKQFLDFAFAHPEMDTIRCPCQKCNNTKIKTRMEVHSDLLWKGITPGYIKWIYHGEGFIMPANRTATEVNDMEIDDECRGVIEDFMAAEEDPNFGASHFHQLLKDSEEPLYEGCKNYSRLSFTVHLLHIKSRGGLSNRWFDALLKLLIKAFPNALLPKSHYEANKTIRNLGLSYERIDACKNDCILFWKDHKLFNRCPVCNSSRWKIDMKATDDDSDSASRKGKIPEKTLRYFRLKPRIQRLYMSSKTSPHMTWHRTKRKNDAVMRHPADAETWKHFDIQHPTFSSDPRNIRLGLASDGMNPYGNMTNPHSTWPVVLINYNLPPWMCMKEENFILSMIIPGPRSPGNDICVYLQVLIEELQQLWEPGQRIYDAFKKEMFLCRVALIATVNDFPALAMLSGWSTKGQYACPCCGPDACSLRLRNGGKWCYMYHRRFLQPEHHWRNHKRAFNNRTEHRGPPRQLNGYDIAEQLSHFEQVQFGKNANQESLKQITPVAFNHNWKKKSIFYQELPYVKTLLLFHHLDVMHIEKNICDIILSTILNVEGRTKDNIKAREDLKEMGIRPELHLKSVKNNPGKLTKPPASYVMSKPDREIFCKRLKEIKVPDGYSSNISRCVNLKERKLMGLKSHDCHVLMEQFLPIAIRGLLPDDVCEALTELCLFFRVLCTRVLHMEDLDNLQERIAITMCKLERIFPPSFFVVMMHLPIHLVEQAKLTGPVQYYWMYPVERYLRTLKSFVGNKACPEGSMAKGYQSKESLVLISRHLHSADTKFNQSERNDDDMEESGEELAVFRQSGWSIGKEKPRYLNDAEWHQIQLCVLQNCDEARVFEEEHIAQLGADRNASKRHAKEFPNWFRNRIYQLQRETGQVSKELLSLAGGPCREALSFRGHILKGYRYHTRDWEQQRKTQNSGIFVKGRDDDDQQEEPAMDFYGTLTEIIEVWYAGRFRVLLFKCEWRDVTTERGCKKDKYGFTCVNVDRSAWKDEPFVVARLAEQVFYVKDEDNHPWHVAIRTQPRSSFNIPEKVNTEEELCADYSSPAVAFQEKYSGFSIDDLGDQAHEDDNDNFAWERDDVPVETVDYVAEVDSQRQYDDDDDDDDLETTYTDSSDEDEAFVSNNNDDGMDFD